MLKYMLFYRYFNKPSPMVPPIKSRNRQRQRHIPNIILHFHPLTFLIIIIQHLNTWQLEAWLEQLTIIANIKNIHIFMTIT